MPRRWKLLRLGLLVLTTFVALVFVLRELAAVKAAGGITLLPVASPMWLGVSIMLATSSIWFAGSAFALCFQPTHRQRLPSLFAASQIAKYVPGRVWQVVMHRLALDSETTWSTVLKANIVVFGMVCTAQVASALAALLFLTHATWALPVLLVAIGVTPKLIGATLVTFVRFGLSEKFLLPQLTVDGWRFGFILLLLSASSFIAWLALYAGAFALPLNASNSLVFVSLIAWLAGLFSVLPAGLGVREAAFMALSADFLVMPEVPVVAALALMSRVWLLIVDAVSAILGACVLLYYRTRK